MPANTAIAATVTTQATHSTWHVSIDGQEVLATENSGDAVCAWLAERLGVSKVGCNYLAKPIAFLADGKVVATATLERRTGEEPVAHWLWHVTGAAYFPYELDGADGKVYRLTGKTGHSVDGLFVAEYATGPQRGAEKLWATKAGGVVDGQIFEITAE